METSNILIIVASVVVVMLAWKTVARRRQAGNNHVAQARRAIDACACLLKLIGHIQQHRGMSSAFIGGDRSFEPRLFTKRGEIEPLLRQLHDVAKHENDARHPCFTLNDYSLLKHRWEALLEGYGNLTVERSITMHSQIIAILINWLDAVGEARIELPMGEALPRGIVRNYAHRLPLLTECLGQARATGSGVAVKGTCSAVARVRLMFLVSRAESLIEQACAVDERGAVVAAAVKELAQMTRARMLNGQQVSVTAEQYFSEATRAIDAVFGWIKQSGDIIDQRLTTIETGKHMELGLSAK